MADKASLQVIGFVLASITAGIVVIAAALVQASSGSRLGDHRAPSQVERTAGSHGS